MSHMLLRAALVAAFISSATASCSGLTTLTAPVTFNDGTLPDAEYSPSAYCEWQVTAPSPTDILVLTYTRFDVSFIYGVGWTCFNDKVEVFDGTSSSDTKTASDCGHPSNPAYNDVFPGSAVTGPDMYVVFTSDHDTFVGLGFEATVTAQTAFTCDAGPTQLTGSGDLTITPFAAALDCTWEIVPDTPDHAPTITVSNVNLPLGDSPTCTTDAFIVSADGVELGRYCEHQTTEVSLSAPNRGQTLTVRLLTSGGGAGVTASYTNTPCAAVLTPDSSTFLRHLCDFTVVTPPAETFVAPLALTFSSDFSAPCGSADVSAYVNHATTPAWTYCGSNRGEFSSPPLPAGAVITVNITGDATSTVTLASSASPAAPACTSTTDSGTVAGYWSSTRRLLSTVANPYKIAVGDLDGDVDVDVVAIGAASIQAYINTGTAFADPFDIFPTTGVADDGAVIMMDVDSDGDMDVVAGSNAEHGADPVIAWYDNIGGPGNGMFSGAQNIINNDAALVSLAAADLNTDGAMDLVVAQSINVYWLANTGSGLGSTKTTITTALVVVYHMAVADLDGDGRDDVLVCKWGSTNTVTFAWHHNADSGGGVPSFTETVLESGVGGLDNVKMLVADVSGDGLPDIVTCAEFDNTVQWFANTGVTGTGAISTTATAIATDVSEVSWIGAGDFDKDGDIDIVSVALVGGVVQLHGNTGGGSFPANATSTIASLTTFSQASSIDGTSRLSGGVLDIDLDGDLDLMLASSSQSALAWYENVLSFDTTLDSATSTTLFSGPSDAQAVYVLTADVNADGAADVFEVQGRNAGGGIRYMLSDGVGGHGAKQELAVSNTIADAALGLMNNDAAVDIVVVHNPENTIAYYPNLGSGGGYLFSGTRTVVTAAGEGVQDITIANMDGDGDEDIVSVSGSGVRWWENNGDGTFVATSHLVASFAAAQAWVVDVDDDGIDDVVALSEDGALTVNDPSEYQFAWFQGLGGAAFQSEPRLMVATSPTRPPTFYRRLGQAVTDVDGDGDADIISTSSSSPKGVVWFENVGNGTFSEAFTVSTVLESATWLDVADVDRDGAVDVVAVEPTRNVVGWVRGLGAGSAGAFDATSASLSTVTSASAVAAGDINGDGSVDLVAALFVTSGVEAVYGQNIAVVAASGHPSVADAMVSAPTATAAHVTVTVSGTVALGDPGLFTAVPQHVTVLGPGTITCPSDWLAPPLTPCAGSGTGSLTFRDVTLSGCGAGVVIASGIRVAFDNVVFEATSGLSGDSVVASTGSTVSVFRGEVATGGLAAIDGSLSVRATTVTCPEGVSSALTSRTSCLCSTTTRAVLSVTSTTVANCTSAVNGGGLLVDGGEATVEGSTLVGNAASGYGGGVFVTGGGSATLDACFVGGNDAANGGGVAVNGDGSVQVTSSTLAGNAASGLGASMYVLATSSASSSLVSSSSLSGSVYDDESGRETTPGLVLTSTWVGGGVQTRVGASGVVTSIVESTAQLNTTAVALVVEGVPGEVSLSQLRSEVGFVGVDGLEQVAALSADGTDVTCVLGVPDFPDVGVGAGTRIVVAGESVADFPSVTVAGEVGLTYDVQVNCTGGGNTASGGVLVSPRITLRIPSCDVGSEPEPLQRRSCQVCAAGWYGSNGTACEVCGAGNITTSTGRQVCDRCPRGTAANSAHTACDDCGSGTASPDGVACVACPAGSVAPAAAGECTECAPGSAPSPDGGSCVPCAAGTYGDGLTCTQCGLGNVTVTAGLPSCTPCGLGTITNAARTACEPCAAGSFSDDRMTCSLCPDGNITVTSGQSQCTPCSLGTVTNAGRTSCNPCGAGTASRDGVTCAPCAGNEAAPAGSGSCTVCGGGSSPSVDGSSCVACAAGTFGDGFSCTQCGLGNVTVTAGLPVCTPCASGTITNTARTACEPCAAGSASNDGITCSACGANEVAPAGSGSCTACSPGSSPSPDRTQCVLCAAGTYGDGFSCTQCGLGNVTVTAGLPQCTPCALGSVTNAARTACEPCAAGSYSSDRLSCSLCELGNVTTTAGQPACTTCAAGTITNAARTACEACPVGSSSTDRVTCEPCAAGYVAASGAQSCQACVAGWEPTPDASECVQCAEGFFSVNGTVCERCPPATVSTVRGSPSCASCSPGSFANAARSVCELCPAGTHQLNGVCTPCGPGTYATAGSVTCTECPKDTYREEERGVSPASCTTCALTDANMVTRGLGATSLDLCVCRSGFYQSDNGTACVECSDPGLNCTGDGLTVEALVLNEGYWRASQVSTQILECRLEGVCAGGSFKALGASSQCEDHHTGPMCELCEEGFALDHNGECTECETGSVIVLTTAGIVVLVVLGVAAVIGGAVAVVVKMPRSSFTMCVKRVVCCRRTREVRQALQRGENQEGESHWKAMWVGKLKIGLAFVQVAGVVVSEYSIPFPNVVDEVSGWFSWARFDLFVLFKLGCKADDFDQFNRLIAVTAFPLAVFAGLAALGAVFSAFSRTRPWSKQCLVAGLVLSFAVFPGVSAEIVKTFSCLELDTGESYLRADVSISCDSSKYDTMVAYSWAMIVCYPVAIPLVYFFLLFANRRAIFPKNANRVVKITQDGTSLTLTVDGTTLTPAAQDKLERLVRHCSQRLKSSGAAPAAWHPHAVQRRSLGGALYSYDIETGSSRNQHIVQGMVDRWHLSTYDMGYDVAARDENEDIEHLAFLFGDYEPKYWYMEVVELVRKFILSAVVLLFMPDTAAQILFAFCIAIIALGLYVSFHPYVRDSDDSVAVTAHLAIFLQLFAGLVLRVADTMEADEFANGPLDRDAIGGLVVFLMLATPTMAIVATVVGIYGELWADFLDDHEEHPELELLSLREKLMLVGGCKRLVTQSAVDKKTPVSEPRSVEGAQGPLVFANPQTLERHDTPVLPFSNPLAASRTSRASAAATRVRRAPAEGVGGEVGGDMEAKSVL